MLSYWLDPHVSYQYPIECNGRQCTGTRASSSGRGFSHTMIETIKIIRQNADVDHVQTQQSCFATR